MSTQGHTLLASFILLDASIAAKPGKDSVTFYSHDDGLRQQLERLGLGFIFDAYPFHFTGQKAIYKPLLSQLLELYEVGQPVTVRRQGGELLVLPVRIFLLLLCIVLPHATLLPFSESCPCELSFCWCASSASSSFFT